MDTLNKIQRVTLSVQIEKVLKTELVLGNLRPGARLVTRELADHLGVSLTPVREALLQMVALDLLQAHHSQAFIVPCVPAGHYEEMDLIRHQLEKLAIIDAVAQLDAEMLQTLGRRLDTYLEVCAAKGPDVELWAGQVLQARMQFLFSLFRLSGKTILVGMLELLWLRMSEGLRQRWLLCEQQHMVGYGYDELSTALARKDVVQTLLLVNKGWPVATAGEAF